MKKPRIIKVIFITIAVCIGIYFLVLMPIRNEVEKQVLRKYEINSVKQVSLNVKSYIEKGNITLPAHEIFLEKICKSPKIIKEEINLLYNPETKFEELKNSKKEILIYREISLFADGTIKH